VQSLHLSLIVCPLQTISTAQCSCWEIPGTLLDRVGDVNVTSWSHVHWQRTVSLTARMLPESTDTFSLAARNEDTQIHAAARSRVGWHQQSGTNADNGRTPTPPVCALHARWTPVHRCRPGQAGRQRVHVCLAVVDRQQLWTPGRQVDCSPTSERARMQLTWRRHQSLQRFVRNP